MTDPVKLNGAFRDGIQMVWDSTSISLAQTCLRKYYYTMIEGWHPRGQSVHLRFGGHYATALEHYYKHVALGLESKEALYLVVKEALEATYDDVVVKVAIEETDTGIVTPAVLERRPWVSDHPTKTRENLIRTIVWYVDQFSSDPTEVVILAGGKPAVELSFKLEVDDNIVFSGHIDRLVTYAGDTYAMDQKTTGATISKYFFDQFKPNTQMSMYAFASHAIWNVPVKGVIIDGAQIAVGFTRFERGYTFRTERELNEWYGDTLQWIAQAQAATKAERFPMNPASCGNYGGCQFRHVCSRSPEVRGSFLKADFEKGPTWDPTVTR